jgi:hypothetical protein
MSNEIIHTSDCAINNLPALPAGPCNCRAELASSGANSPTRRTGAVRMVSVQDTPCITPEDCINDILTILCDGGTDADQIDKITSRITRHRQRA